MKSIKEKLEEIREDLNLWKSPKYSGADMSQALLPAIRIIDEILEEFKTGKVLISVKEYDEMEKDQEWLRCLEHAGVDNWEGYDYAVDLQRENRKGE